MTDELLLADPGYPRLKQYVIEATGLNYYSDKDGDLVRRLTPRLANSGARDCTTYLQALGDPRRGPVELEALIADVAIGETHFFRHREHFDALRDLVIPELAARNAATRRLRIWSAGCANGSEAYSLSMLMRRDLGALLAGWDVTILATDINRKDLADARDGLFEEWAFRSMNPDLKQACFTREGRRWRIAPGYKEGVTFQVHNLVEQAFPAPFDLIVCRNVMIYFGAERMRRVIRQFHESLEPAGWLLVGPSEPNMTCFTWFRPVNAPGVTLYQKATQATYEAAAAPVPWPPPEPVTHPRSKPAAAPVPTLADLRRWADRGEWDNALRCGERLLVVDGLNPLVHFHHALVQEQVGNHDEAERSLRKAIYLDRNSVLAHYYLGLVLRSRGETRQAARSFENSLELMASRAGSEALGADDDEAITVDELRKLAQTQIDTLGGAA